MNGFGVFDWICPNKHNLWTTHYGRFKLPIWDWIHKVPIRVGELAASVSGGDLVHVSS